MRGSDTVVFVAGSGPGSGAARKLTTDRDGAIKLLEATTVESSQYVMLSGQGVGNPPDGDDVFIVYLRAKAHADAPVMASDRDWTVVRPGRLTNDAPTGRVRIETVEFGGESPRADLAVVLAGIVGEPHARRRVLYVNSGAQRIDEALAAALVDPAVGSVRKSRARRPRIPCSTCGRLH